MHRPVDGCLLCLLELQIWKSSLTLSVLNANWNSCNFPTMRRWTWNSHSVPTLTVGGLIYPKPRLFSGKVPFYSLFKIHAPVASLMLQPVVKNLHAKFLHLNISQSCLARSSYIRPAKALTINSGGLVVYRFGYQKSINLSDLIDLF